MIKLIRTKSDHADFRNLVAMLDADLLSRYGPLQAHYDQFNSTAGIDTVVVAYVITIRQGAVVSNGLTALKWRLRGCL
jgi:hypothetical protein